MAAIKGQPAPKPGSLPKSETPSDALAEFQATAKEFEASPEALAAFNQAASQVQAPPPTPAAAPEQVDSPWLVENLPAIGGVVGSMVGAVGGPMGMVGGAALGGAAGKAYRELIETQILGKREQDPMAVAQDVAVEGLKEGAGQAIGMGVAKVGGKILKPVAEKLKLGEKIAQPIKEYITSVYKNLSDEIMAPVTKLTSEKASKLDSFTAGQAVKDSINKTIQTKYAPFIKAYEELDTIGKALPVNDEARRKFTTNVKGWALEDLGRDNYNVVKKFADDIDAAGNGKQISDVIKQIADMKRTLYKNGATNQANVLKELEAKASDFLENETLKLATKIQSGKAAPNEIGFIQSIMQQRGVQEPNPTKYAKSLAKDFLSSREKVKNEYRFFSEFLRDVAEQTKIKNVNGAKTLMDDIADVPNEVLIEKMFQPKNSAALAKLQQSMPEVFEQVKSSKISNILKKSSPNGNLDVKSFYKELNDLPDRTRGFLYSNEEMNLIKSIANNGKLKALKKAEEDGGLAVLKIAQKMALEAEYAAKLVAPAAKKAAQIGAQRAGVKAVEYSGLPDYLKRKQER